MSNNLSLQEYFMKYNLDYTRVKHKHKKNLSTDSTIYTIESKGDKTGPVVTKNNDVCVTGSIELFPFFQLLKVKVNISSWNNHRNHWIKKEWNEEEIIQFIFKILKKN